MLHSLQDFCLRVSRNSFQFSGANSTSTWWLNGWLLGAFTPLFWATVPPVVSWPLIVALLFAVLAAIRLPVLRFFIAGLIGAIVLASMQFSTARGNTLAHHLQGQTLTIQGRVLGLPLTSPERTRFDFQVQNSGSGEIIGKRLRLNCYRCRFAIEPGQQWQFDVRLKQPNGFASWAAFDYERHLFRYQISATGYVRDNQNAQLLGKGRWSVDQWRWWLRSRLIPNEDEVSVGKAMLMALLIGDKSWLTHEQRQVFQVTGVSHLMAISGLHIGLVFLAAWGCIAFILNRVPKVYNAIPRPTLAGVLALAPALAYAALAGFAVSTQRALIMLTVVVCCRLLARPVNLLKSLQLAAVAVLLIDPLSIFDYGFWLSFTAVLVIALGQLRFASLSLLTIQPLIWLGMMPMTLVFFGQVSLISPVVNLILVPVFCVLLIPASLLSLILLPVNSWSAVAVDLLDWIFSGIYTVLWRISELSGVIWTPSSSILWMCLVPLLVLGTRHWAWLFKAGLIIVACALAWQPPTRIPAGDYEITLLDVGQGLSMVIRTRSQVWVYDTGPAYRTGFNAADAVLIPYLRRLRVDHIDHLVISHADNDHIGGLPRVLKQFRVREISTSRPDKVTGGQACFADQSWSIDQVTFSFISPDASTPDGSNNRSCVLLVDNGSVRTLITGDIEKQVESYLLEADADLRANIMLVPHQGSKTSSTPAFLNRINPSLALVAAGYRNHYGHPHPDVVARYRKRNIDLLSTIDSGSILLKINRFGWSAHRFRVDNKRFWRRQLAP